MANILVCDDDREIADAIEIYLRSEGHKVIKAYNGQEALDKMEGEEIHLVVMDIMMPVLNGIEATLKLREKSHVPVILLSAKSEDLIIIFFQLSQKIMIRSLDLISELMIMLQNPLIHLNLLQELNLS